MAREQDGVALNQARNARRESEEAHRVNIEDLANLGRAIGMVVAGLGVSLGPVLPDTLVEEVRRLPGVIWELELSTARRAVHRVLAMFESHYQGLDLMALSGGWALDISDQALLWSHGGVGVRKLGLLNPLRVTTHSQPPRAREVREVTLRSFVVKVVFSTGVQAVTRTLAKRGWAKT
jgi:hypothetical protein